MEGPAVVDVQPERSVRAVVRERRGRRGRRRVVREGMVRW